MSQKVTTHVLLAGLALSLLVLAGALPSFHLPGNQEDYQPHQPIAFSHRLHSSELAIDCLYCHYAAEKSRHAGIPAASICMNCHKFITATMGAFQAEDKARLLALAKEEERPSNPVISKELAKLYEALGLDDKTRERDSEKSQQPIAWIKVHNLPDFVYFDHRSHLIAGVECQQCHDAGEMVDTAMETVDTMEQVRQMQSLTMGWCVNCHREVNQLGVNEKDVHASLDCTTCHY